MYAYSPYTLRWHVKLADAAVTCATTSTLEAGKARYLVVGLANGELVWLADGTPTHFVSIPGSVEAVRQCFGLSLELSMDCAGGKRTV